jgi:hypothetical protein
MAEHRQSVRRASLSVEQLEDRLTPSASGFVTATYQYLLHRTPAASEVNFWVNQLLSNTRTVVANQIWSSQEHRIDEVTFYYQQYLQRQPDSPGLTFWVTQLVNGTLTEDAVQESFVNSTEYQLLHPSNTAFVQALYADVLFRAGSTPEVNAWVGVLQGGGSRTVVVLAFFQSMERIQGPNAPAGVEGVIAYYRDLLKRAPDTPGENFWVNFVLSGQGSLQATGVQFLASSEFDKLNP